MVRACLLWREARFGSLFDKVMTTVRGGAGTSEALEEPMWRALSLSAFAVACSGDDKGEALTDSGAPAGDTSALASGVDGWPADQNCPDGVPEAVAALWDCQLNSCSDDSDTITYRLGYGTSTADSLSLTEEFWTFHRDREFTVDSFSIEGTLPDDGTNVSTFSCDSCEEIWKYKRTEVSNESGSWYSYTFNDKNNDSGVYNGYMMFDTHSAFGDRNPDDAALIYAVHFNSSWSDWDKGRSEWGRGTSTPTGSEDAPPEEYWYRSPSGSCSGDYGGGGSGWGS